MINITIYKASQFYEALNQVASENGGNIYLDWIGESEDFLKFEPVLKRADRVSIIGRGKQTVLRAQAYKGGVLKFDTNGTDSISDFRLSDLTIRKVNGNNPDNSLGGLISHERVDLPNGLGQRLVNSTFKNLNIIMDSKHIGEGLFIEGALHCKYENISFEGGAIESTAFYQSGSYAQINDIYQPNKGTGGNFMNVRSSYGSIINCKSEGGRGEYELLVRDSVNPLIQNFTSEGNLAVNSIVIEKCNTFQIIGGGIGGPDRDAIESNGLVIRNSSNGYVKKLDLGARRDRGRAIHIDKDCKHIELDCRIRNTDYQTGQNAGGKPVADEVLVENYQFVSLMKANDLDSGELFVKSY